MGFANLKKEKLSNKRNNIKDREEIFQNIGVYNMQKIDMENWPRKQHFDFFNKFDYPHFDISVEIDIKHLIKYIKVKDISFFKTMVFLVTKNVNKIEEFKYRIINNEQVVILDKVNPSFTIMGDNNVFSFCNSKYHENMKEFFESMDRNINKYKEDPIVSSSENDLNAVYLTSIPWLSFKSITHPIDIKNVDSNPRISWGKYYQENDKVLLPFSIQVHHALMDGYHVSKYINSLKEMVSKPKKYLK